MESAYRSIPIQVICPECNSYNVKEIAGAVLTSFPAWHPFSCQECGQKFRKQKEKIIWHSEDELLAEFPYESHQTNEQSCDEAKTKCNHDFLPKKNDLTEKGV